MHNTLLFPLILLVVLVGLGLVAAIIIKLRGGSPLGKTAPDTVAYEPQDALLTPAECSFFGVLEQVAGSQFRLFAKVRLADIVKPAQGENRSGRQLEPAHVHAPVCALHHQLLKENGKSPARGRNLRCHVQLLSRSQITWRENARNGGRFNRSRLDD
jgi:hypothetical protein